MHDLTLFSGNANIPLAEDIAKSLRVPLGRAKVQKFSDGEANIEILENVRGRDVFLIQPTCFPTNVNLMELCLLADAVHRSSAVRITAVIPYYGYARQDRRVRSARVPISAKVVADMLQSVGINRILTVDLHSDQIQGFFGIPVDNAYGSWVFLDDVHKKKLKNLTVVAPDIGGVVRARAFAKRIEGSELAIIEKKRSRANEAEVLNIIGNVYDRDCFLVDDIVDTAGTLCTAANALIKQGAKSVHAYCTHPVLSGEAIENINCSELTELVVTDTIPLTPQANQCTKLRKLTIAKMLAEIIKRINKEESISCMFNELF